MAQALRILAFAVFVLGITVAGNADCRRFFQPSIVHQAVIAQPVVLYQAGVNVEQEALAERIAQRVEARIIQRLQAAKEPQQIVQQQAQQTALGQHCSKCHSGATPKAGITLDGATAVNCRQITQSLRAIAAGKMPKDHKLTPDQAGAVMQQLLDLELQDAPQPVPMEELK